MKVPAACVALAASAERGQLDVERFFLFFADVDGREPLAAARDRHRQVLAELPPQARQLSRGEPAIPTVFENGDERS